MGFNLKMNTNYEEMFKAFLFLFDDSEDIKENKYKVKKNLEVFKERDKYANLSLKYLEENISQMSPINLLTTVELLSIGESLHYIKYKRIHQFEKDFLMALVLKYGEIKQKYRKREDPDTIEKLLNAIRIYLICFQHNIHSLKLNQTKQKMTALTINSRYRTCQIVGFDDNKFELIKEFCSEYDKQKNRPVSLTNVVNFLLAIHNIIKNRIDKSAGERCLEKQYYIFMFTSQDINEICHEKGYDFSKTISIINKFCCNFETLKSNDVSEMYLYNPVNENFIIKLNQDTYFLPNFNIILENIFSVFEKIIGFNQLEDYSKTKSLFLEKKNAELVNDKFKDFGDVHVNSQWDDERHGENDCLLLYENYAIIFEDKSGKVNPNTYKGIMKNIYSDSQNLISDATIQATDFAALLKKNTGTIQKFKVRGENDNCIDLTKTEHILSVGVVLEDTPLQNISLDTTHIPILSIFQLYNVFKCLEKEEIIDYFEKRTLFEQVGPYIGDEYDFLYNYLENGLNKPDLWDANPGFPRILPFVDRGITRDDLIREEWFQRVLDDILTSNNTKKLDVAISILGILPQLQSEIIQSIYKLKKISFMDTVKNRDKKIIVELLEFYDCDTEDEIEREINNNSGHSEVLYIAFTKQYEHIIVKLKKSN